MVAGAGADAETGADDLRLLVDLLEVCDASCTDSSTSPSSWISVAFDVFESSSSSESTTAVRLVARRERVAILWG